MTIEITVDQSGLAEIVEKFPGVAERAIELMASEVWRGIRKESPVDHGLLAGSWQLQQLGPLFYGISSPVKYRWYVNEGTRPHVIEPKDKKALAFVMDGEWVVCRRVHHHPGTRGQHYINWAMEDAEDRVDEFADRAISEVLGGTL